MRHHKFVCTPGRIVLQEFEAGKVRPGVAFFRWQMLEDTLCGDQYVYDGMVDRYTWTWVARASAEEAA